MRAIPTRTHGGLDHVVGPVLILAPMLLGFADRGPAQLVPQALGVATIGLVMLTDDEMGLLRLVPMRVHLLADFAAGGVLRSATAPASGHGWP